jgi:hypothetical protein
VGHERNDHWSGSVDSYTHEFVITHTVTDRDIFEFEAPPTPPKNPPQIIGAGASGEAGDQSNQPGAGQPPRSNSKSLNFTVSDAAPKTPDPPRRRGVHAYDLMRELNQTTGIYQRQADAAKDVRPILEETQAVILDTNPVTGPWMTNLRVGTGFDYGRNQEVGTGSRIAEGVAVSLPVVFAFADDLGRIAKSLVGHADEVAEVAAEAGRVENKLDDVVRVANPRAVVASKLSQAESDAFRKAAREIWLRETGTLASAQGLRIHHRIPLEWSHIFPKANPNRLANLVGVDNATHKLINNAWVAWKQALGGRIPTQAEVMRKALDIDSMYGHLFKFPK